MLTQVMSTPHAPEKGLDFLTKLKSIVGGSGAMAALVGGVLGWVDVSHTYSWLTYVAAVVGALLVSLYLHVGSEKRHP